ncbi:resistance to Congo red protein [uncultured Maribacter sp.]|uniref:resistance to Congo red protein n=1 Tax=uncultured Maribacter sp. TaxID=431308 RepID=UPI00263129C5|nr:resistance to Congo red protein [uncultured Maribacter sp.]
MKSNNNSTILGLVLLSVFFVFYFGNIEWVWLQELQQQENYKRWSGLGVALFIIFQWLLTFTRVIKRFRQNAIKMITIHKWLGAMSPLLFYIHSVKLGYGYIALMSYLFFANALLGYINLDVIKSKGEILFKGWMIFHVAFSIIISILMCFHIVMVFYYK